LRGTRPKHREEPHKLLQVGATPTPATKFSTANSENRNSREAPLRRTRAERIKSVESIAIRLSFGFGGSELGFRQGSVPAARR
jgi:hypothetical protein